MKRLTFVSHHRTMAALLALGLAVVVLALVGPVAAQDPTRVVTDDEVNAIAKDLYCPVCESTPLDVCPTQACADWREVIRIKLSQGQTKREIEAYFAEQYGARALAAPPREGFTLAVWVAPILLIVVAAVFFTGYMRRLRSENGPGTKAASPTANPTTEPTSPPPADDYHARIERELRED
jgi:cytochrome c-type biogenesis protein CcmH